MGNFSTILLVIVSLVIAMVLHEMAHGLAAYWLGDETAKAEGRLSFNPLKHFDPFLSFLLPLVMILSGGPIMGGAKPVPINTSRLKFGAWGMALTAIAGPLTNFILSFLGYVVFAFAPLDLFWQNAIAVFVQVNLGLALFNILPIPPLDGSRVLYALAPDSVRRGFDKIESAGLFLVFLIVIFAGTFISLFIGRAEFWVVNELFPRILFLK